jgi:hypothetical protein
MLATEILMPHSLFRTLAQEQLSISKVWELSRVFGTSLTATALRGAQLVGCSAFEIEGDMISWGYGIVRKGRLKDLDQDLQIAVRQAEGSETGEAQVYIWNQKWQGDCKLEWTRPRRGSRTLFLLQPVSQVRQSSDGLREARAV